MDSIDKDHESQLDRVLKDLENIRDKLIEVNTMNGNIARFRLIKEEIKQMGWPAVCAKYHPDININDPAAYELFQLYRFVYSTMERENTIN